MGSFVFDFSDEEVKADEAAKEALKDPAKGIGSHRIGDKGCNSRESDPGA